MADVTVASLNIRGVPLTGSRLAARCHAIGTFFEASDVDVVCLQEVHSYAHLTLMTRQMRSFRYVSFQRALPGPAGDVVTFSRIPVSSTAFRGLGPVTAPIPWQARLRARMKGALVTKLIENLREERDHYRTVSETFARAIHVPTVENDNLCQDSGKTLSSTVRPLTPLR